VDTIARSGVCAPQCYGDARVAAKQGLGSLLLRASSQWTEPVRLSVRMIGAVSTELTPGSDASGPVRYS
jgi:hypothetical protein